MQQLDCGELRRLLDAFEDNELDGVTSLSVQEHLDGCAGCRAHRFWHAEMRASLGRLRNRTPGAPSELRQRVRRDLAPPRRAARWLAGAAAAVLALAAAGLWLARPLNAAEPMAFARNHLTSLEMPDRVRFTTDSAGAAEAWLRQRLSFSVEVPRQPPAGFQLAGARVCSVDGRKVAYLLYDSDDSRPPVSLYIGPPGACKPVGLLPIPATGAAVVRRGECDGVAVAAWESAESAYVLTGDLPPSVIVEYAQRENRS